MGFGAYVRRESGGELGLGAATADGSYKFIVAEFAVEAFLEQPSHRRETDIRGSIHSPAE
jgi:hypothetical protein